MTKKTKLSKLSNLTKLSKLTKLIKLSKLTKTKIGYDPTGEIKEFLLSRSCSGRDRKFKSIFLIDSTGYVVASQKCLPDFPCRHFLVKNNTAQNQNEFQSEVEEAKVVNVTAQNQSEVEVNAIDTNKVVTELLGQDGGEMTVHCIVDQPSGTIQVTEIVGESLPLLYQVDDMANKSLATNNTAQNQSEVEEEDTNKVVNITGGDGGESQPSGTIQLDTEIEGESLTLFYQVDDMAIRTDIMVNIWKGSDWKGIKMERIGLKGLDVKGLNLERIG